MRSTRNNRSERGGIASVPIFHQQSNFYSETDRVSFLRGEQYIQQCIKMDQKHISWFGNFRKYSFNFDRSQKSPPLVDRVTSSSDSFFIPHDPIMPNWKKGGRRRKGFVTRRRDNDESLLAGLHTFRRKVGAKERVFPMKNAKGIHIVFFN